MSPEEKQAASQASIAAGGLPLNAIERLQDQASRQSTKSHIFTSDLSVHELLLTHQCGFEPLGQVMGSSIYHVGWYAGPGWSWVSGELDVLTQAYYQARHLAMNRLRMEAKILGATGVVGVRLTEAGYDWGEGLIEFMAVGTAVREINAPPLAESAMPFVSGLSGQEHYSLRQIGYRPTGFCLGNCIWMQYASYQTAMATGGGIFGSSWYNQELSDYTWGAYRAREIAMERMQMEARQTGAAGVVGVNIQMSQRQYDTGNNNQSKALILYFWSHGTAVAQDYSAPKEGSIKPTVLLGAKWSGELQFTDLSVT